MAMKLALRHHPQQIHSLPRSLRLHILDNRSKSVVAAASSAFFQSFHQPSAEAACQRRRRGKMTNGYHGLGNEIVSGSVPVTAISDRVLQFQGEEISSFSSGPGEVISRAWSSWQVALRSASISLVARHPDVYEPCDDSFVLVDALLAEKMKLLEQRPSLCLEVGCGSGYVITSLALILGDDVNAQFLATDISRTAAQVTRETLSAHGIQADVVVTDLVHGLEKRLAGSVDVLLFNPPYVPTPEHEVGAAGIAAAWAGGERGRVVIDRMLTMVDNLLSNKGWFYMVTLTANNPSEICQIMKKKGFASRIVLQRYTEEENLHILKFWRGTCL